jgi:hypothetical protein
MNYYRLHFSNYTAIYFKSDKPIEQLSRLISLAYGLRAPSGAIFNPKRYNYLEQATSIDNRDVQTIKTLEEILVD